MTASKGSTRRTRRRAEWVDPDDAPELTAEWFERAQWMDGERVVRLGRPSIAFPKVQVTLRLSPEVIAGFKADGPGWQTRIDETLKRVLRRRAAPAEPAGKTAAGPAAKSAKPTRKRVTARRKSG